jgi:hypothetical protein
LVKQAKDLREANETILNLWKEEETKRKRAEE